MSFLLDTNAVSEPQRPRPDQGYLAWLAGQDSSALFLSVLTLGELKRGIIGLDPGPKRVALEAWLGAAATLFADRVLPIDAAVASVWAEIALRHRRAGLVVGLGDELIAATALAHGHVVVTRNIRHFEHSGCLVVCPWLDAAS